MSKYRVTFFLSFLIFLSSCAVVKEGFKSPKQKTSDEFLVENKSPLIMPPNVNELPLPEYSNQKNKEEDEKIESLVSKSENKRQSLEKSILEKIK